MKLEVITRKPEGQAKPTPLLFVHGICQAADHILSWLPRWGMRGVIKNSP